MALEIVLGELLLALPDEDLQVHGLGRLHRLAERRIVGRHLAPAEHAQPLADRDLLVDVADRLAPFRIARHEQKADGVFAGRRQREAELGGLAGEELVRDLHQDAGAVAGARIGADRAAMLEVEQDRQRVLDDLVRLAALDVGNEPDAAGILVERRIIKTARARTPGSALSTKRAPVRRSAAPSTLIEPCRAHLVLTSPAGARLLTMGLPRTCLVRSAYRRNGSGRTAFAKGSLTAGFRLFA